MTLRDELDDAIERAFVEPLRIADGEDGDVVRALERGRLASSPDRMRRVVLIQQAVADVLARSDDRLQARLALATHALAVLLRLYYEIDDLSPEEIKRRMLDAINDGTRTPMTPPVPVDPSGRRIPVGLDSWAMCLACGGYLREMSRDDRFIQAECEGCGEHTERYTLARQRSREGATG